MKYRELVVMTRPLRASESTPGHAMIAVSTEGGQVEAWGFYRDRNKKGIHVWDETVKGRWERYTTSSVIPISSRQYKQLKAEINQWRSKSYTVLYRDCTDFVLAVMHAAKIPTPKDSIFPGNLGEDMSKMHGTAWGRCLGPQPKSARKTALNWREEPPSMCVDDEPLMSKIDLAPMSSPDQ